MKITQVAVDVLRVPVDRPYLAGGRTVDANWHVLARITTSDGVEGIGYIVYPRPDLMTTIGHAARELGEHLIGMSVLEPEAAWDRLARRGDWVGPGGLLHCALAPLDIAVWDAARQDARPAAASAPRRLSRSAPDVRERRPLVQPVARTSSRPRRSATSTSGFGAVKLRLGQEATPELEVRRVQAVRDAVGPDVRIMVDAIESWSLTRARRAGRALQDAGIAWLEDPVHHLDVAGLADAPASARGADRGRRAPLSPGRLSHAPGGARRRRADSRPGPGGRRDAVAEDRGPRAGASRFRCAATWCPRSRCTCSRPSRTATWWSTCPARPASSRRCRGSRTASSWRRTVPASVSSSTTRRCDAIGSRSRMLKKHPAAPPHSGSS